MEKQLQYRGTVESYLCMLEAADEVSEQRVFGQSGRASALDVAMTFAQLRRPNKSEPRSIISIEVKRYEPGFTPEFALKQKGIDILFSDSPTLNVTPQYAVVDLRIGAYRSASAMYLTESWRKDNALGALSTPLEGCEKVFLLFPSTSRNLKWFSEHQTGINRRSGLVALEYGLLADLSSDKTLYIPAGWIHATLTTRGGFLLSFDCATHDTLDMIALCSHVGVVEHMSLLETLLVCTQAHFNKCTVSGSRDSLAAKAKRIWVDVLLNASRSMAGGKHYDQRVLESWQKRAASFWTSLQEDDFVKKRLGLAVRFVEAQKTTLTEYIEKAHSAVTGSIAHHRAVLSCMQADPSTELRATIKAVTDMAYACAEVEGSLLLSPPRNSAPQKDVKHITGQRSVCSAAPSATSGKYDALGR